MGTTDLVIIGGGCSGVLVACSVLHATKTPISITIIEKSRDLGQGLAYSTSCATHILNVPNQNMSAFPEQPTHFLSWLQDNNLNADPLGFSKRLDYARYLQETLEQTRKQASHFGAHLKVVNAEAMRLQRNHNAWQISLSNNESLYSQTVVLALGVFLSPNTSSNYISNPWEFNFKSVPKTSKVAIVGSGLSTVDMLLLLKQLQWQGEITVLSRSGNMPLAHNLASYSAKLAIKWPVGVSVLETFKVFINEFRKYTPQDYPWQSVIDSVRPYTQQIWQAWSDTDKRIFLRHLKSTWDQHRHRIAPEIARAINQLQEELFFTLQQHSCKPNDPILAAYDLIIDCTGLKTDYTQVPSPLLQDLFARELIKPGPLGKGIQATANFELQPQLYTLGFTLHGQLWESIAVPELRQQAAGIAHNVLAALKTERKNGHRPKL